VAVTRGRLAASLASASDLENRGHEAERLGTCGLAVLLLLYLSPVPFKLLVRLLQQKGLLHGDARGRLQIHILSLVGLSTRANGLGLFSFHGLNRLLSGQLRLDVSTVGRLCPSFLVACGGVGRISLLRALTRRSEECVPLFSFKVKHKTVV